MAEQLGVVISLPDELIEVYRGFGIELERFYAVGDGRLPLPGRIIVDQAGLVRDVELHADHTSRPDPLQSLAILNAI